ncbi:hypothetical protein ILYODFUR_016904 [Ilyodon furcidens]|uniref:Uncharacterized protein n=1 Tax=Ilyodon furcidens TaxID=33524 RepID=A0ABV0TCH4_9TELE
MPAGAPVPEQVYWLERQESTPAQYRWVLLVGKEAQAGDRELLVNVSQLSAAHQSTANWSMATSYCNGEMQTEDKLVLLEQRSMFLHCPTEFSNIRIFLI